MENRNIYIDKANKKISIIKISIITFNTLKKGGKGKIQNI